MGGPDISDAEGLEHAYRSDSGFFKHNHILYISGSRTVADWANNPRIALGGVHTTPKYKAAEQVLALYPEVRHLVGHSLGASIAKNLANSKGLTYEVYNNPAMSWQRDPHSHRHWLDPISILDRGASSTFHGFDPLSAHSYRGD